MDKSERWRQVIFFARTGLAQLLFALWIYLADGKLITSFLIALMVGLALLSVHAWRNYVGGWRHVIDGSTVGRRMED